MAQQRVQLPPQLAAMAQMTGASTPMPADNIGQYMTAAMLAASSIHCDCETCKLVNRAAKAVRRQLAEEGDNGGS